AAAPFSRHQSAAVSVTCTHDGAFVASLGWDGSLRLWDCGSEKETLQKMIAGQIFSFGHSVYNLGYCSGAGRLGVLELVPANGWRVFRSKRGQQDRTIDCEFSRDGRLLLSAHEHSVRLWDVAAGREIGVALRT